MRLFLKARMLTEEGLRCLASRYRSWDFVSRYLDRFLRLRLCGKLGIWPIVVREALESVYHDSITVQLVVSWRFLAPPLLLC